MMMQIWHNITSLPHHPKAGLIAVLLLTALLFSNGLWNGFILDDWDYIHGWPLIQRWSNWPGFFVDFKAPKGQEGVYSPIKTVLHAINYHVFGHQPLGHHLFSMTIHLVIVALVYKLSYLLTQERWVAFFSAWIFGWHPVHAIAASATAGVDLVGVLALFYSFYHLILFYRLETVNKKRRYILSLLFAFIAVYTTELLVSVPLLYAWYVICLQPRDKVKQGLWQILPFMIVVVSYVCAKYFAVARISRGGYLFDSRYLTLLVMIKSFAKYIWISFFPIVLTHNHVISPGIFSFDASDFDPQAVLSQSFWDVSVLLSMVLLGAALSLIGLFWKKHRLTSFLVGWFFICLAPTSQIIPTSVYFGERYLYPGSFAFCLLLALALHTIFYKRRLHPRYKRLASLAVCAYLLFLGVRLFFRISDGRDDRTVFEAAVRANPRSALMRTDLGAAYLRYNQPQEALQALEGAQKIKPQNPDIYFQKAEAYIQLNDLDAAIQALQQAIALDSSFNDAYYNLAGVYAMKGDRTSAMVYLNKALQLYQQAGLDEEAEELRRSFTEYFKFP
jgi:tetratricopeptide (TPR) repeat protein